MSKSKSNDPRVLIDQKMIAEGRKLAWLADKTGINYHTLYSIIKTKAWPLSEENLKKINKALETEYELTAA